MIDQALRRLASRGLKRGLGGEPMWLVVGAAAWLVRRSRGRSPVVWSGRLEPGERLVISSSGPGQSPASLPD